MKSIILFIFLWSGLYAQKPELFLLDTYNKDQNISSWYMSEKLDGIRAYWDGERLISRSGKVIDAPKSFTKGFPDFELDGELWSKREDFSNIVSIVKQKKSAKSWSELTYNIFEVPNSEGNLTIRLHKIENYLKDHPHTTIKVVKQIQVSSDAELKKFLKNLENKGAEGVVIRDGSLDYYTGRTQSALKVKSYIDDECEVVGYNRGHGKYEGLIGSLSCRMKDMKIINIGSGLSDDQRTTPPAIGTTITFKYYGLTSKGNPRFPVFLRIKND